MSEKNHYIALSVIYAILGLTCVSLAQGGTWTAKTDMLTARGGLSASVADGKIYAIGGSLTNGGENLRTVEEYNPVIDIWATKKNIPTSRRLHCAAVVDGIIYVIGGDVTGCKVEAYNPATDTWATKTDMITGRGALACAVVNRKIYVMGGTYSPNWPSLKTVEEYDPDTDTWATKAGMHNGRYCFAASVVDSIIYAIGGASGGSSSSTVEAYNPATDTWTEKAGRMSVGREDHAACTVNGIIYVIGGFRRSGGTLSIVEAYDPGTDTFTVKTPMPTPRMQLGYGSVNGKIYVIGGFQEAYSGAVGLKIVEEYTPHITLVEKKPIHIPESFILHQNYPNPFNPITTIEFDLLKTSEVSLKVFKILGEEVVTLVSDRLTAGSYSYEWDASNLASGVYLYRLQAGDYIETRKMVLMR